MGRMWRRDRVTDALENHRAEPSAEHVDELSASIEPRPKRVTPRSVIAVAIASVMVVSMAGLGGVGYAATTAGHAASAVASVVSPGKVVAHKGTTVAAAQYGHNHGCTWHKKWRHWDCPRNVKKWHCVKRPKHWHCVVHGKAHVVVAENDPAAATA